MFVEKCDWISATNEGPPDVQLQVDVVIDMLGEDIETERPVDRLELLVVVVIAELHPLLGNPARHLVDALSPLDDSVLALPGTIAFVGVN